MGKNTRLGRFLRRVFGDEAGGVMMEYVILGLLVAAAVVVAVMYFGKTLKSGFSAMGQAAAGEAGKAKTEIDKARTAADDIEAKGEAHRAHMAKE